MTRREAGGVSIVMLGVLVVALALTLAGARLGGALVGRARADSAADAAALAAADRLALGDDAGSAKAAAAETAAHNGARLVSCACDGTRAEVVVEVDIPALQLVAPTARGRAAAEVRPECIVDGPDCG